MPLAVELIELRHRGAGGSGRVEVPLAGSSCEIIII